jgi:hypothetical protein
MSSTNKDSLEIPTSFLPDEYRTKEDQWIPMDIYQTQVNLSQMPEDPPKRARVHPPVDSFFENKFADKEKIKK